MDDFDHSVWQRKGATLSDKTARKEYGLTQDEIVEAIRAGRLQYSEKSSTTNANFLRSSLRVESVRSTLVGTERRMGRRRS